MKQALATLNTVRVATSISGFIKFSPRMFFLLFMLVLSVTVVAQGAAQDQPTDVFDAFTDFFPGQPASMRVLEKLGFTCRNETIPSPADVTENCQKSLDSVTFSQMRLSVWDGVVVGLDFTVRETALNTGDMTLLYGAPEIEAVGQWVTMHWPELHIRASGKAPGGFFTYLLPLSQVSMQAA